MEKGWNDLQRLKLPRRGSNRQSSGEDGEPAPGIPAPGTVTAVTPLPLSGQFKLGSGAERGAGVRPHSRLHPSHFPSLSPLLHVRRPESFKPPRRGAAPGPAPPRGAEVGGRAGGGR